MFGKIHSEPSVDEKMPMFSATNSEKAEKTQSISPGSTSSGRTDHNKDQLGCTQVVGSCGKIQMNPVPSKSLNVKHIICSHIMPYIRPGSGQFPPYFLSLLFVSVQLTFKIPLKNLQNQRPYSISYEILHCSVKVEDPRLEKVLLTPKSQHFSTSTARNRLAPNTQTIRLGSRLTRGNHFAELEQPRTNMSHEKCPYPIHYFIKVGQQPGVLCLYMPLKKAW